MCCTLYGDTCCGCDSDKERTLEQWCDALIPCFVFPLQRNAWRPWPSIYPILSSPCLSYCDKAKKEWQLLSVGPNPIVTPPEQRAILYLLYSRRPFWLWLDRTDFRHTVRQATSDWCWVVWHQKHVETDRHGDQDNEVQFRYVSVEAKMKKWCFMSVLKYKTTLWKPKTTLMVSQNLGRGRLLIPILVIGGWEKWKTPKSAYCISLIL